MGMASYQDGLSPFPIITPRVASVPHLSSHYSRPQELLHHPQHGLPKELATHEDGSRRGQRTRQRGLQPQLPGGHRPPAPPHRPPTQPGRHQGEAHRVRLPARHRRQIRLRRPEVRQRLLFNCHPLNHFFFL